jgi:pimeloyl-ACP methyl ester carboxylesterase
MVFPPLHLLGAWRRGLLTAGLLGAGAYLLGRWYSHRRAARASPGYGEPLPASVRRPAEGALLLGGLALGAWCLGGGWLVERLRRRHCPQDWPGPLGGGDVRRLRRPDGTELHVVLHGPPDGPPVVLTPGWGADTEEWAYTRRDLAGRYRLIAWDLPGLGKSSPPRDGDWSMERLARDLKAVLQVAGGRGAVLVGHSLGAMIILEFCRLFPEALGTTVRGLVLGHVTYTNPARTTTDPGLTTALQKPVFEPVCHLTAHLAPLVRVLAWLCYLSGEAHRLLEAGLFSGHESWEQLDFLARYYLWTWPVAPAQYTLAMFRYDVTATLAAIHVPTLIVVGDQDGNCAPEAQAFMARVMPNARLLTLRPARHAGLIEHYRTFDLALAGFVDACAAG